MPVHDHEVTYTPSRHGQTRWKLTVRGEVIALGTAPTVGQARQAAAAALLAFRTREFAGAVLAGAK